MARRTKIRPSKPQPSKARPSKLERLRRQLWIAFAICVVIGFLCMQFHAPSFSPLVSKGAWTVTGDGFFAVPGAPKADMDSSIRQSPQVQFFRSLKPDGKPTIDAALQSQPFRAPEILVVPFTGYPIEPDIRLAVRCLGTGREMAIATGNAHEYWVQRVMQIPSSFCGGPVQIIAADRSAHYYVGVGTPFAGSRWHLVKDSVFTLIYLHFLAFALVVAPVAFFTHVARRLGLAQGKEWLAGVAGLGLLAFGIFFLLQVSKDAAITVSFALYIACIFVGVRALTAQGIKPTLKSMTDWRVPVLFTFSLFAVLLLEMVDVGAATWNAAYRFSPAIWSSDHIWPSIVADGLWMGRPAPTIFSGWHVSDRPPLMAGLLLLVRPLTDVFGPRASAPGLAHLLPKIVGIIANAAIALLIIEVLVLRRGAPPRPRWMRVTVVLIVLTSPFILFNVIFTWPKLLSAFFAMAAVIVLARNNDQPVWRDVPLAGVLFGLALLSHSGVALGLIAVPLAVRAIGGRWRLRETAAAALVAGLCWVPWSFWQKYVDPPGNALVKFALTGSYGFDDQQRSVTDTVRSFAANLTWDKWLEQKWMAIKTLVGLDYHVSWIDPHIKTSIGAMRLRDFLFVLPSLRFLGIAIVAIGLIALWRRRRAEIPAGMGSWLIIGVAGVCVALLLLWTDHINHTQSYFSMVALLLACGLALLALPPRLMIILAVAQAVYVLVVWILDPIWTHGRVFWLIAAGALAALGLTTIELLRLTRNELS